MVEDDMRSTHDHPPNNEEKVRPRKVQPPQEASSQDAIFWERTPLPPGFEGQEERIDPGKGRSQALLRQLWELLQTLLIAGVLFVGVNLVTARIRVESVSMLPSLQEGEFVVINRLAYLFNSPDRGDIIVFKFPLDPNRRYIKRVIGLPGDAVHVQDGQVFINDESLIEPYIAGPSRYNGDYLVGEGELFVMGDNRGNSLDSRNWGNLPMDHVIGRAELIYWPPAAMGLIPHYEVVSAVTE